MSQVNLAVERYAAALESGEGLRKGVISVDTIAELTGGGVTVQGVRALAEYLAHCKALETGTKPKDAFKGPWQEEICRWIGEHTYSAIQAPRRLGKTYSVALWGTLYIAAGYRVILALPTMRAGTRLIFRQIIENIARLAGAFPALGEKRIVDQPSMGEILLPNAGQLICLSSDKDANVEGYGCEYLIIDEAHRTALTRVAIFQPFTDDAVEQGIGRVTLLGIGGGPTTCALEGVKFLHTEEPEDGDVDLTKIASYQNLRYRADDMPLQFPEQAKELKSRFDKARATMTKQDYDEQYNTEPGSEGTDKIFQTGIAKFAEWHQGIFEPVLWAGIDPGKKRDDSVLAVLEVAPSKFAFSPPKMAVNVVKIISPPRNTPYPEQARFYREELERMGIPANQVVVETNGVGEGLADIMAEHWPGVNYYWADAWYNSFLVGQLQEAARVRTFGVHDDDTRRELGDLYVIREATPDGTIKTIFQHSDKLAAIRAAMFGAAAA